MTLFEALKWGEYCLKATSQEPETDSLRCLEAATALSKSQIFSRVQESLSEIHLATFHALIQKRATGCPLAYVLGEAWFLGDLYQVNPGVLIPRHDTEILVQEAMVCCHKNQIQTAIECGFGSGIISISLAKRYPKTQFLAWDLSDAAYEIALQNAARHQVAINWQKGDFFEVSSQWSPFIESDEPSLLISNPPYIPLADIQTLEAQVRDFEPHLALAGGEDGLDFYRQFAFHLKKARRTWFLAEVGIHQQAALTALFAPLGEVSWTDDLQGIPRVITLKID